MSCISSPGRMACVQRRRQAGSVGVRQPQLRSVVQPSSNSTYQTEDKKENRSRLMSYVQEGRMSVGGPDRLYPGGPASQASAHNAARQLRCARKCSQQADTAMPYMSS